MAVGENPEDLLESAVTALADGAGFESVLDDLPAPIYTTDADGNVTYWNRACVDLAGRVPELGRDRWCVTWQLYTTTGERMPHDQCPMADAIRQKCTIRDQIAIALRPDGSRIAFKPYPTPLFDGDGSLRGAVNMLIDVSEEQSEALVEQAARCRRLADALYTRESSTVLETMAERFEKTAADIRGPTA